MKVFISYRTDAEPDRALCDQLSAAFKAAGHQVFVDQQLQVGDYWAKEIERGLQEANFLVLLLSEDSSHSEMVLGEVEKTRDIATRRNGAPKILPVRVAYRGKLPYPLNGYVDPLQQLIWGGPQSPASPNSMTKMIGIQP